MPVLSQGQIAQVARQGGLPGDPDVWAAIAMAESSGRTDVVNSIGCVGLWQINQPVHVKTHPTWTKAWLSNPVNNAKAAAWIYRAQGMAAWEAYTGPDGKGSDGPWRNYYKGGNAATAQAIDFDWKDPFGLWPESMDPHLKGPLDEFFGDEPTDEFGNPVGGLEDVARGIGTVAEAVQKGAVWLGNARNWVRIGYVVGGGILVVMGLSIVAKPLLGATPAGRVAKKVTGGGGRKAKAAPAPAKKTKKTADDDGGDDGGDDGE